MIAVFTLALVGLGQPAQSQSLPTPPAVYAADYGQWALQGQAKNTYLFAGRSICNANAPAGTFFVFALNAPVYIADVTTSSSEVVTPTAITSGGSKCGVSVAPANQHYSFSLRSGTGGLQEALNTIGAGSSGYTSIVFLDKNWYTAAGSVPGTTPAAIIAAAKGNTRVALRDLTTVPETIYTWSGSAYTALGFTGTKTAGSCVIVYKNGLVTGITGC